MGLGLITIPHTGWIGLVGAMLAAILALLIWSYWRAPQFGVAHIVAFALKLLGVLILGVCLIEPLWSSMQAKSGANLLVVVADNSQGMAVRDRGQILTRGQTLQRTMDLGKAGWLATLAEDFQVRGYVFDSRLRRTTDFSELVFDGKASALGMTLRTLAQRYRGRPLAGVLLMTDGIATDAAGLMSDLSGLPPVYPVVVGGSQPPKDIAVGNVTVSQTSFEDAPVTIQADVEASGYSGRTAAVDLIDDSGALVEHQTWQVRNSDAKQVFRFRLRPDRTGILFYRLRVAEASGDRSVDPCEASSEATQANNECTVVVDRGSGPYRVLYVAGRPNWEYKFLQRAISEDEQVQLVGLIRAARREPKYDWRGRASEQSNPLYRGFEGHDQEQTEQYDQPVLVRLNTRDEAELRDGFPRTPRELFGYQAVILDDVEAQFFSHDQMELVRRFVGDRGGGFLMLGGKDSFQNGGYERSPIGSLLPVYLDRLPAGSSAHAGRLTLTREGWLEPWVRVRDNEQDERQQLSSMPDFRAFNRVRAAKPGASVLATIGDDPAGPFPAMIVHRYGNGRSAALTIGDVWRWGLAKPQIHPDMDKFWRQTVRWLVADVPHRISLQAVAKPDPVSQPVMLQVRARDEDFEPMDTASVVVEVNDPRGQTVRLATEARPTESGLFEAVYVPRFSGGYAARAVVTDPNGTEIGTAQTGWAADLEASEFQSIRTNRPLLDQIARQTGGRIIELGELGEFARSLPHGHAPVTTVWVRPLWDLPGLLCGILVLILGCLITEWAIRRWKGLQ